MKIENERTFFWVSMISASDRCWMMDSDFAGKMDWTSWLAQLRWRERVRVCVCVRERDINCVLKCEMKREHLRCACVRCVSVFMNERGKNVSWSVRQKESVWQNEREIEWNRWRNCESVCAWEMRERGWKIDWCCFIRRDVKVDEGKTWSASTKLLTDE